MRRPTALCTTATVGPKAERVDELDRAVLDLLGRLPLTWEPLDPDKLAATAVSLFVIVKMVLSVPVAGSVGLWFLGVVLYLFFATALGVFLGTIARSMAQFALLIILVVVVMQLLSGGTTPVESQPVWLQYITFFLPSRHFISFSQVIIYRGGGIRAVWPQFLMVGAMGLAFFGYSLVMFRKSIAVTK